MNESEKNLYLEKYNDRTHVWGRIVCIVVLILLIGAPFLMGACLGAMPDLGAFGRGFLSVGLVWMVSSVAEYLIYTPMLGAGGGYLAFITGNLINMKIPCAVNARDIAGTKTGTAENEVISTLSIAASSLVTILVLAAGVVLLVPLQPILQDPALQPAFDNVVPALFGAMAYKYFRHNMKIALVPLIFMSLLFILVPALTSSTSFMIIPSGAIAIGISFWFFRRKANAADSALRTEGFLMKYVWFVLLGLAALLVLLLLIAVLRTLLMPRKKSDYKPKPDEARALAYAEKLSRMIRCETVSGPDDPQTEKFRSFHRLLEELFPLVHQQLEKTEIDGNLLFYWKGKSHEHPILLMSHQDVVPAEGKWLHEPFSGDIAGGKVWGRGAADTKCSVMAFFQAIEELLQTGYVPAEDVYLASSCTEEWAGDGAPKLVNELKRRGVRLFLVCDEGGGIISEPIGGIHGNYAMIGVFEKGKADVKFTASGNGGHASAPPRHSPIAQLAEFVHDVETHSPFRRKFLPEVASMFSTLAPTPGSGLRLVLGNLWLFAPLLKIVLPMISAQAGAMLQTTIAFTMQSGSDACNVLPQEASVWANMRFIPHQGEQESLQIMERLAQKHHLSMQVLSSGDYSKAVDIHGAAFRQVEQAIQLCFPGLASSPYVMTGATDAHFYQDICDSCIRFAPVIYGPEQMKGMHGLNENIELDCLPGAVDFYKTLIRLQENARH